MQEMDFNATVGPLCLLPVHKCQNVLVTFFQDWLSRYGYLPPPDLRTSKLQTKDGIEKAIRVMQRFGGVQETGVLGNSLEHACAIFHVCVTVNVRLSYDASWNLLCSFIALV